MVRVSMRLLVLGLMLAGLAGHAEAVTILTFAPNSSAPALPEFIWDGNSLIAGAGSVSNGDGDLGTGPGATAPGLLISVPFVINGVPGSDVTAGSTTFFDATLEITSGFNAPAGPAGDAVSFFGLLAQALDGGTFEIRSSNIGGGDQLLLSGTIDNAVMSGLNGTGSSGLISSTVTYTGGLVYDALVNGGFATTGELSWSLISIVSPLGIGENGRLAPFVADASGLFSATVIPEPASIALLGAGALAMLRRRR